MTEIVEQEADLLAMASLVTPMTVRMAATLRLADHLTPEPRTAQELASLVGANVDILDRLLRHLCSIGVLYSDSLGVYRLTSRGEPLREGHPSQLRARLTVEGAEGRADLCLTHLLHTVCTGKPAFPEQYGQPFWDDLSTHEAVAESFHRRMATAIGSAAPAIVAAYNWGSLGHVVDVGGGSGALLIAMLRKYPDLRGTVVDLPPVADLARQAFAEAGLAGQATAVAGSFFDPLPADAGGYVLSAVIHNWDDDQARAILRRCAEATGDDGRVFVIEKIGADGGSLSTETDLRMAAYFGARERNLAEIRRLVSSAQLDVTGIHAADGCVVVEMVSGR